LHLKWGEALEYVGGIDEAKTQFLDESGMSAFGAKRTLGLSISWSLLSADGFDRKPSRAKPYRLTVDGWSAGRLVG
jgi:hypothetical protein